MNADEELLNRSLAMLATELDDAGTERRVTEFRGSLRRLRDDPAEVARIDALVMEAEGGELAASAATGNPIYASGDTVNIYHGLTGEAGAAEERVNADLARMDQEIQTLRTLLAERFEQPRARPRRAWETLLWPAFGGGVLVAVLAAATVAVAVHTSVATLSIIGVTLAVTTAVTALVSLLMPWTSVRRLNRVGRPEIALELLLRGGPSGSPRQEVADQLAASRSGENPQRLAVREATPVPAGPIATEVLTSRQGASWYESHASRNSLTVCPECAAALIPGDEFCGNCGAQARTG